MQVDIYDYVGRGRDFPEDEWRDHNGLVVKVYPGADQLRLGALAAGLTVDEQLATDDSQRLRRWTALLLPCTNATVHGVLITGYVYVGMSEPPSLASSRQAAFVANTMAKLATSWYVRRNIVFNFFGFVWPDLK